MNRKTIIIYNVIILFNLYFIIAAAFSLIYILLDYADIGFIVDHYSSGIHQEQFIDIVTRSLYFSFITLFAVGYGDMTPFGFAKAVSMVQAFVGFILPYAILLNYIIYRPKLNKRNK
jgi:potassium channel LctB